MTTSGLAVPPRAAPPRVPRLEPEPSIPLRPPERGRTSFGRILGWSLLVSLLLHLLFFTLSPVFVIVGVPESDSAAADPEPRAFGMEMIVAIPSENAPEDPPTVLPDERPVPAFQRPLPERSPPQSGAASEPPSVAPEPGRRGSASEVLRPGLRDSRLYVAPRHFPDLEKTEHERYLEHLQARIDAVNDSMNIASARNRQTRDWVITDASGRRWGMSSEGLHLGGVTLPPELVPRPRATGDNQSIEAERERQRRRDEIQRQEESAERRDVRDERTGAIREGEDRRRSGGGGR